MREASVWSQLRHPNILPFIAVYINLPSELSLASLWMENGDIVSYIASNPSADIQRLVLNVTDGLRFMHSIGIVHGDLKSSNVLINEWHNACLCDFGLSTFHHTNTMTPRIDSLISAGSLRWSAPEQLFDGGSEPNQAVDVYAFGILLWELISCRTPYDHIRSDVLILQKVTDGMRPCQSCVLEAPGFITLAAKQSVYSLMSECWSSDASSRPNMEDTFFLSRLTDPAASGLPIISATFSGKARILLVLQPLLGFFGVATLQLPYRSPSNNVFLISTTPSIPFFLISAIRFSLSGHIKLASFRITIWTDLRFILQITAHNLTFLHVFGIGVSILELCINLVIVVYSTERPEDLPMMASVLLLLAVWAQLFLSWYPDFGYLVSEFSRRWGRWKMKMLTDSHQTHNRRIYITKLPDSATSESIREVFNTAGEVEWASLHSDCSGNGLGHAVVEFKTDEGGETALRMFDNYTMEGQRIQVGKCVSINWGAQER
ncbi:kinase-like protein [Gymnopus androsaceus JB14]|uniref:Kinase-like protein n=1 Tax=Gymnopus androsaceus JB14 TaxID=1447944 RepID=A0A6A4HN79_9AGAR|nr:kinase-like protein [Gymnopus androsaceus JB14]